MIDAHSIKFISNHQCLYFLPQNIHIQFRRQRFTPNSEYYVLEIVNPVLSERIITIQNIDLYQLRTTFSIKTVANSNVWVAGVGFLPAPADPSHFVETT